MIKKTQQSLSDSESFFPDHFPQLLEEKWMGADGAPVRRQEVGFAQLFFLVKPQYF